ncbi:MAG: aldo/keto reductase [Bacteroidota bacterium]|nr:aldo/keto reductase [Bacteroidota bacterium]
MNRREFFQWAAAAGIMVPAVSRQVPADDELPRRRLGSTDEYVTMLGLGGWHLGRMNERVAEEAVEVAMAGGIRFYDSAESYQSGGSERYLGRFLSPKYRDQVYLMTKTTARTGRAARRHLEASLKRMNTDYLDLWQVHAIMTPQDVDGRIAGGLLDTALEAVREGKTRHIGFTGHNDPAAHRHMLASTDIFQTVQMPVNVADVSYKSFVRTVLPKLVDRDIGVIAMKTLANGGFFGGSSHGQHGRNPRVVPNRISIRDALYFAWSLPISVLVTGPDNINQLQEKIELARSFTALTEEERGTLIERVADMAGRRVEFYKS